MIHIYIKHTSIGTNEIEKNDEKRCDERFRSKSKIDAIRRLHVPTIARVRVFRPVSDFPLNSIFVTNSHRDFFFFFWMITGSPTSR